MLMSDLKMSIFYISEVVYSYQVHICVHNCRGSTAAYWVRMHSISFIMLYYILLWCVSHSFLGDTHYVIICGVSP